MPINTTVALEPAKALPGINTIVAQQEGYHGAIKAIGNDGTTTLLTFENTPAKPSKKAVVTPHNAGVPVVPAGATLICTGTIFIAGQLTLASAAR